ncbi:hypothetical protein [Paenibacillus polymyxa]|uniref:hypothetical protein n=1 Tax=Paenibacillus polymyxa TaxID=1406 RepID=UPI0005CDDA6D|nr:hypothetical protein [Paenibacillus polymyxa]MBY7740155.1 hypothetical protein [Paenibacillus polymyxa]
MLNTMHLALPGWNTPWQSKILIASRPKTADFAVSPDLEDLATELYFTAYYGRVYGGKLENNNEDLCQGLQ